MASFFDLNIMIFHVTYFLILLYTSEYLSLGVHFHGLLLWRALTHFMPHPISIPPENTRKPLGFLCFQVA